MDSLTCRGARYHLVRAVVVGFIESHVRDEAHERGYGGRAYCGRPHLSGRPARCRHRRWQAGALPTPPQATHRAPTVPGVGMRAGNTRRVQGGRSRE